MRMFRTKLNWPGCRATARHAGVIVIGLVIIQDVTQVRHQINSINSWRTCGTLGTRLISRHYNHPCVVIGSMGNESEIGTNHHRIKEAVLALDKTRPIRYEGGNNLKLSDFLCDGYSSTDMHIP